MGYIIVITDYLEQESWHVYCDTLNDIYKYFDFVDNPNFARGLLEKSKASIAHIHYNIIWLEDYS